MKLGARTAVVALGALAGALASADAGAQMPEGPEPAWETAPYVRRGGFTAGFSIGGALGMASGFPNDSKKIGRAAYYTETGLGLGGAGTLWIGAGLADWLVFQLGLTHDRLAPSEGAVEDTSILFKVDAFPLFGAGGIYRDLGFSLEAGVGGATVKDGDTTLVDGGAPSRVGGAIFYEGLRLWKLSTGPTAGANYVWSDTVRRGEAVLGWRLVLYVKP